MDGSGERVGNRGQIKLRMKAKDDECLLVSSVFQVAEITRPLMSVSRICDQDMVCIFEKTHARVVDSDGNVVARFEVLEVVVANMLKGKDCQPEELRLKTRTMAMQRRRLCSDMHSRHPTCQQFPRYVRTRQPTCPTEVGATSASSRQRMAALSSAWSE